MSVFVVRAFIRMRDTVRTHAAIARRLAALEKKVGRHDHALKDVLAAVRALIAPRRPRRRRTIGFAPAAFVTPAAVPAKRLGRRSE
jgi:ferric-dicitrate binding protein FerR (iron transport regulator)